jgi:multiple sugar transport system permease protein
MRAEDNPGMQDTGTSKIRRVSSSDIPLSSSPCLRVSVVKSSFPRSLALSRVATYAALILGSALFIVPFLFALSASLKKLDGVYAYPPTLLPGEPQWGNYTRAVTLLPFGLFLLNSGVVTLACVAGQLLTGSLVAYSFARLRWPGRDLMFVVLLSTMMLPGQVTMIPLYLVFRNLGWIDTFLPLIVPAFLAGGSGAFYVFLLRQFFMTLPRELDEVARLDGCSSLRIYWHILLPLCKPVIATIAVFSFIANWNDFMGPLIYLNSPENQTLALGLRSFQGTYTTHLHLLMAAATLVLLPILVVFFFAQKQFIRSVALTGIKG